MRTQTTLLGLAALGLAPGWALALPGGDQPTVVPLVQQTDTIIGIGELTSITYVSITNDRNWTAVIDTAFSDSDTDGALLRNGFVTLREGTTLFNPPGSVLDDWISVSFADNGHLGMLLRTRQGATVVDGAFWNLVPVALKDEVIEAVPLGPNSDWDRFDVIKLNNRNELFVMGDIDNTSVSGTREDALIRYTLGPAGQVLDTTVLATKGMSVPVLGTNINALGNTEHVLDVNNHGDFIVYISGVGKNAVLINMDRIAAQELDPAPAPNGRTWKTLALTKVSINDRGDYIVTGSLDGTSNNYLISKNNTKFAQSGDLFPSMSASRLDNGSSAPVVVANNGDVFWSPRFVGGTDDCFARNYETIVQEGQTVIDGHLVSSVTAGENGFAVSRDGRFWVGRVELQGLGSAALFADYGLVLELPGCEANRGKLNYVSGSARLGCQFTISIDNAQKVGAIPALVFSTGPAMQDSDCGIHTPFGELLFSPPRTRRIIVLPAWTGTPIQRTFNIPNDIALMDAAFWSQVAFYDASPAALEEYRLSNGMRIEIGAP